MSTNDEIRKAEALRGIDYAMDWKKNRPDAVKFAEGLACARQYIIDSSLAPHPAQQGEDGELLDWLDSHWHDWQKYITTDSDGWAYRSSDHSWHEANTLRAAIRAARSHSKQEGGA